MRHYFTMLQGRLHISPVHGVADFTNVRLALHVGIGAAAPFALALITDAFFQQPGAGLVIGTTFATAIVIRTVTAAGQFDTEHDLKIAHARALSRIEIRELEAALPRRQKPTGHPHAAQQCRRSRIHARKSAC